MYLGMQFNYTEPGKVKIGMIKYIKDMQDEFPITFKSTDKASLPAGDSLFNKGQGKKLETKHSEAFHMMVVKGLFLCKRARHDMQPTIAVLCTRVK
jgi:hypothetical protein